MTELKRVPRRPCVACDADSSSHEQHLNEDALLDASSSSDVSANIDMNDKGSQGSTSCHDTSDAYRSAQPYEQSTSPLLNLPRELRDMIYAELIVHCVDPSSIKPTSNPHAYQYIPLVREMCRTGYPRPYNLPGAVVLPLKLVCRQIYAEIKDLATATNTTDAELEITCHSPKTFQPLWTRLPLIRPRGQSMNISLTLRLRIYEVLEPELDNWALIDLIDALIRPETPSVETMPWRKEILERVYAQVARFKITTVCEDIYTPGQYQERVVSLPKKLLGMRRAGFTISEVNGERLSADGYVVN